MDHMKHMVNNKHKAINDLINNSTLDEVRKIQFSGKSSYMLSLPKKWVEEMGLKSGDQVSIGRQSNASLIISPRGNVDHGIKSEIRIELSQKDSAGSLVRKLISLYLSGYKIIHVRAKNGLLSSTQREVVKEAGRRHLAGTEIVADSTEGITLQVLLSYPELSVENALRRIFLIVSSMHKDAMHALTFLDKDSAKGVIKTDDEVDRFCIYIIRQLKMAVQSDRILKDIGLTTPTDCLGYRLIVKSVERVADHAVKIAQRVLIIDSPLDKSISDKINQLSEFSLNLFDESGLALFKRDYASADKIVEKAELIITLRNDLLNLIEKNKHVEAYTPLYLITENIRRTAEYASDIAEVVLNMTIE